MFFLWLLACGHEPETPEVQLDIFRSRLPVAPWDPILVSAALERVVRTENGEIDHLESYCVGLEDLDDGECEDDWSVAEPIVEGPEGERVELEPLLYAGWTYAWAPVGEWAPGQYHLRGIVEAPEAPVDVPFTVESWGECTGFDPQSIVGRVFDVTYGGWTEPTGQVGDLGWWGVGEPQLEIRSVDETGLAEFRLVTTTPQLESPCVVLHDVATLSPEGRLEWSRDHLEVEFEGETIESWNMWFTAGFRTDSPDTSVWAGGGTVDTARISAALAADTDTYSEDNFCEAAAALGIYCVPCPEDAGAYCLGATTYQNLMVDHAATLPDDLPLCGIDIDQMESLSCNVDWDSANCGSCTGTGVQGGVPSVFSILSALWFRRSIQPREGGRVGAEGGIARNATPQRLMP